jgi:ABC-type amino acid transport substrate-binding protein
LGANRWVSPPTANTTQPAQTILHRVKQTKTLVCAYCLWPELMEKDPNTGAIKGVVVDIVEEAAKALGATVKWQEEATIDNFIQLLNSDKVDAVCADIARSEYASIGSFFFARLLFELRCLCTAGRQAIRCGTGRHQ